MAVLTRLLPQGNLGECAKLSLLEDAVGHVEVEAPGQVQPVLGLLVLPPTYDLLLWAQHSHFDGRVPVFALGLADVDELQGRLVLAR